MTITLTTTGWTGSSNGVWTDGSNTVIENFGGVVNPGIISNTLSSNDSITGAGGIDTSQASLLQSIKENAGVDTDVKSKVYLFFGVENLGSIKKIGAADPNAGANYAKFTYIDPLLGAVSMITNELINLSLQIKPLIIHSWVLRSDFS